MFGGVETTQQGESTVAEEAALLAAVESPTDDAPVDDAPLDDAVEAVDDARLRSPQRRCIVTGISVDKDGLLRFVVGPDGVVVPDLAGTLPGRGIWVSADSAALEKVINRRLFARAARRAVVVPADLQDRVGLLLRQRLIEGLALARRAGQAISGYDKVREALKQNEFALLLEASDAGSDGGKMRALARAVSDGRLVVLSPLDGAALGQAFGRDRAVHVGLRSGRLAHRITRDAARLAGLLSGAPDRDEPQRRAPQPRLPLNINDQPSEVDD